MHVINEDGIYYKQVPEIVAVISVIAHEDSGKDVSTCMDHGCMYMCVVQVCYQLKCSV